MSYDPNSHEAKKGALGETIVKKILERCGALVTRPDKYGDKALVDFLAVPAGNSKFAARYVEVKVRSALPYAHGQYPCYVFPVVKIEAYKKYMEENNLPVELWIVDPEKGEFLIGYFQTGIPYSIEDKKFIDGKEFPFDQETKFGLMRFYHYAQFGGNFQISDDDLSSLRALDCKKQTVSDFALSVEVEDILTAPNGINIDLLTLRVDSRFFVKVARVSSAIGYVNPSIGMNSPLMKAAERLKVKWYRFPTQRLSGGESYGSKGYYFDIADVPKVLAQYCELHYKAKPGTRQSRYNQAAQELREWFQSVVLPRYICLNESPSLTAVMLPCGVRTPNETLLAIFATKDGAFLSLSQLKTAGLNSCLVHRRYTLSNYEGEFVHYRNLSEVFSLSGNAKLYNWWCKTGFSEVDEASKEFSQSQMFLLRHLGFDLPDEFGKLEQQIEAVIQSLQNKPVWILLKISIGLYRMFNDSKERKTAKNISEACREIRKERPKTFPKIKIILLEKLAKKIGELQTPNGAIIELVMVEDCDKIFAHGAQLAVAAGYQKQSGATSDNSDFSKAVNAAAQFYGIRCGKKDKVTRFVDANDVPAILREFAFNCALNQERYETSTAFLHWWLEHDNIVKNNL